MIKDYHINIFYSEEYQGYVADIPDLESCSALGPSPAEALFEVEKAKDQWLMEAAAQSRPIPEPKYRPEIYSSNIVIKNALQEETLVTVGQPSYDETLTYIAKRVRDHECILFLGSAIHVPPPPELTQYMYPEEKAPPVGYKLSQDLAKKSEYPRQDWWNLQRVAQHFESKKTRFRLVEEIGRTVHAGREPSPILKMLSDLEFPIVITTNYDHLYEQSIDQRFPEDDSSRHYDVSIYSPNKPGKPKLKTVDCSQKPDYKHPYILKIHGDVSKSESIVITDEDYLQFVLRMSDKKAFHPFGTNVRAKLVQWPTLFIGYSLLDYNLRLLLKTLRWKLDASQIPPNYSVDKKPDDVIRDVWENRLQYVSFIILNLWDFVPKLHKLAK